MLIINCLLKHFWNIIWRFRKNINILCFSILCLWNILVISFGDESNAYHCRLSKKIYILSFSTCIGNVFKIAFYLAKFRLNTLLLTAGLPSFPIKESSTGWILWEWGGASKLLSESTSVFAQDVFNFLHKCDDGVCMFLTEWGKFWMRRWMRKDFECPIIVSSLVQRCPQRKWNMSSTFAMSVIVMCLYVIDSLLDEVGFRMRKDFECPIIVSLLVQRCPQRKWNWEWSCKRVIILFQGKMIRRLNDINTQFSNPIWVGNQQNKQTKKANSAISWHTYPDQLCYVQTKFNILFSKNIYNIATSLLNESFKRYL